MIPDDGANGVEFFIGLMYPQFLQANVDQKWSQVEGYSQLAKGINGSLKTAWKETIDANFSDDADRTNVNWDEAIAKLIIHLLNCKKPRDVQWRHHETQYTKHSFDSTNYHFYRLKESIRRMQRLPKGVKPDHLPTARSTVSLSLPRDTISMEDITKFMRLKHESDPNDGTLHHFAEARKARSNGSRSSNGCNEKPFCKDSCSHSHQSDNILNRRHDGSPSRKSYCDDDTSRHRGRDDRRTSNRCQ